MFGANDRLAFSRPFSVVFVLFSHEHVVVCWDILRCLGNLCIIKEFENKTPWREREKGVFLRRTNVK